MRTVPAGSFERISDPVALWRAFVACRRTKRRAPRMAAFDRVAELEVLGLSERLRGGIYRPGAYRLQVIHDPKTRLIAAPTIHDRIVHRAVLDDMGPVYERGFIESSFAWGTGRGPHRAVLFGLSLMRKHRFRLSLDIRRYFLSMHRPTLLELFARRLRDERTVRLLSDLMETGGRVYRTPLAREVLGLDANPLPTDAGLPIGAYLSQWSGALYLDGLDHFVKRVLKIPGYARYQDDFVLFSDDVKALEKARKAISEWLARERRLELNPKRWAVHPTAEAWIFLGYRLSRGGIDASPKLRRRLKQRLRARSAEGSEALARSLASYRGLLLFG